MILVPVVLIVSYRYSSRTRYQKLAEYTLYVSILFLFIVIATNILFKLAVRSGFQVDKFLF
jgi:hypothetical protein